MDINPRNVLPPHQGQDLEIPSPAPLQPSYAGYSPYGVGSYDGAGENSIREYLRALRKHIWLLIGITLIAASISVIYMAGKPDIYTAQARVQVDLENNPGLGASKNGTVVIGGSTSDPTYFNTQLQNLTSTALLRRVVRTLDLEHNQSFLMQNKEQRRSTWENLRRMFGLEKKGANEPGKAAVNDLLTQSVAPSSSGVDLEEAKRLQPFVSALQVGLWVDPVRETRTGSYNKDTRLIDIRFTHPDPEVAAKVVNAVADTFALANLERKTKNTASAGDFLQKRVAELQSQIRSGEEQLLNYAKSRQILSLDGSQNTVVERLAGLNRQLLEAENERKAAEAAYRAAQAPGAAEAMADGDARRAADFEAKLAALREKRSQLLVENTEEWPEVKEIDQQIAALEKQVGEAKTRATSVVLTNLATRYRQAVDREEALRASFAQQRGETLTQNESAINYRIIQQEVETNKQLLDGLLQRSKENDVVMAGTSNNVFVVDYALAPVAPVGPQRLRGVLMASLLGLMGAVGLAILLEHLNDSVRSAEDVDRYLQLSSIGVIPAVGASTKRGLLRAPFALQRRGVKDQDSSPELLMNVESRSPLAEAYRHLRTSVLLATAGRAPRTLLVTSSVPSEGKTTTAVNTALSLAQTGASVLLIDADMRRPRLHGIFGLSNHRGLSTVLSSNISEAEMLNMIQQPPGRDLHVLTSGPIPPNPAELLGSEQMRQMIKTLDGTFTHVVIDSPPVSSFTDAVLTSTMVDGVLIVVRSGKTSRGLVRRTRQTINDVGAKIFGVVLNDVNLREHDYYYYQSYYSHSYYSSETDPKGLAAGTEG